MTIPTPCGCGRVFEAPDSMVGGLANCPACGRAASVPGLRDPFWAWLKALAALVVLGVGLGLSLGLGVDPLLGLGAAATLALLLWLLSRAL